MKKWFNIIIYLSLVFLLYKLYQADYLIIPQIYSLPYLFSSFFFLFLGMIFNPLAWHMVLISKSYKIDFKDSLISVGLSIFAKYIPGKIFVILGRAEYISQTYEIPRHESSTLSLLTQLITIWVGLGLGILGLLLLNSVHTFQGGKVAFLFWFMLTLFIFRPGLQWILTKLGSLFSKKEMAIPHLELKNTLKILPYFVLYWICWCIGFFMLCNALTNELSFEIATGLAFALGGTIGIISIITPGGIGVREGIIGGFLVLMNIPIEIATTIAVSSRLWFLIGEGFIFVLALFVKRFA